MDNLSGSPFGLFITVYFWIFVIVSWGTKFLHVGNRILILIVVAAGVLIENFVDKKSTQITRKHIKSLKTYFYRDYPDVNTKIKSPEKERFFKMQNKLGY